MVEARIPMGICCGSLGGRPKEASEGSALVLVGNGSAATRHVAPYCKDPLTNECSLSTCAGSSRSREHSKRGIKGLCPWDSYELGGLAQQ